MQSRWRDEDARAFVGRYPNVDPALALRTYTSRLLGGDPRLVLHGGGNTSVKLRARDLLGEEIDVICVKGSGWSLADIEPKGHSAVRLAPLLRLRALERLSDEDMVSAQRANLIDQAAATPSVETLLHAYLPACFIDHTHAEAILALTNQPDGDAIIRDTLGGRVGIVPYVMPGFELAQAAARAFEDNPDVEGLVLLNHGVFAFGATAQESYERMIDLVSVAEAAIARRSRRSSGRATPARGHRQAMPADRILPALRGAVARAAGKEWPAHWIFDLRDFGDALTLARRKDLADVATRGVATPDHVIRTKRTPLVLGLPLSDLAGWTRAADAAMAAYTADYRAYFARNVRRFPDGRTPLDPLPRVVAIEGVGLVGVGRDSRAAAIAGDVAQSWASTVLAAEAVGRFEPLAESEIFDMEYWSLEQAKLGKPDSRALLGRVVVVTGGGGVLGSAIAAAFAAEGTEVALLDRDAGAAQGAARAIGGAALGLVCDVTDQQAVERAFAAVCRRFGGLDIIVSNAGAAPTGMMADVPDEALRRSFEVNFFAHQTVARTAVAILRRQGVGGALLFNISKQAVNPGPDFGAYGTAKAAELALMRQYALEHAADGVRVNAVNPDRIRSGLLTDAMVARRAKARGVAEDQYMRANLLGEEVTAADVAQAFVFAAQLRKTTGAVIPVDGGAVAAMLR